MEKKRRGEWAEVGPPKGRQRQNRRERDLLLSFGAHFATLNADLLLGSFRFYAEIARERSTEENALPICANPQ